MIYTVLDIKNEIEKHFPVNYAMDWDNPGLMAGRSDKKVNKIMLALDATAELIDHAVSQDVDMVITHHPLIFRGIKSVNDETAIGNKLLKLIENGISLYSMHTNYDIAPEGMGKAVSKRLDASIISPLEITGDESGSEIGVGFIAELKNKKGTKSLAEEIKEKFGLSGVFFYDAGKDISRVAVCPGSGRGMLGHALSNGCDVLITGDMGHHDGIDALDEGISLIDAGHFGLEQVFVEEMCEFIASHFEGIEIIKDEKAYRQVI
ncbi:MAG: Nif3-like dinuclear metal center hexameric protein [Eubacteriales bacterium]|nr:Nif3-like dinuclear metal center hexameric protein [Eubacteriales bacterium]